MTVGKTQVVIWAVVHALLLLSIATPLAIITFSFMLIPITWLFVHLKTRQLLIVYAASVAPVMILMPSWSLSLLVTSLMFLLPAVVIGTLYKHKDARSAMVTGILVLIGQMLFLFLIISLAGFNLTETLKNSIAISFNTMPEVWGEAGYTQEDLYAGVDYLVRMMPFFIALLAGYLIVVNHAMLRLLNRGQDGLIPGLKPLREWEIPKAFVWYYMIAMLLSLFITEDSQSFWNTVLLNLVPMLTVAFAVQGIGFLFFLTHVKKWNAALPVIGIILAVFLPYVMSLLGVFERMLNLRSTIQKL